MKAMVLAAGLGTRLRPITYGMPKPMAPVANRPIMEHILPAPAPPRLRRDVANLSYLPEQITDRFGDGSGFGVSIEWSFEEKLLGTAGGVRNVREFFGDEPFLVMAADALTDIDLAALRARTTPTTGSRRWRRRASPTRASTASIVTGDDGRVQGFQEKPDPAEALSDLANCMIYVLEPEVFDYFPDADEVDFALDVFPALLGERRAVLRPRRRRLLERRRLSRRVPPGQLRRGLGRGGRSSWTDPRSPRASWPARGPTLPATPRRRAPCCWAPAARSAQGSRFEGPVVVGDGCSIGAGAVLRECVLLDGVTVPERTSLARAIAAQNRAA